MLADDPYHFDALILLGRVLLDEGRSEDARQAFRRVLRFDPRHAGASFYLGVVAGEERRFRDAIGHWRDTIDADPDGELAARARENVAAAMEFARIFRTGDAALQPA
jgi:cytochrome c-type biogenesis protein CcmH/NrfG